jgi:hypothetical protein
MDDPIFLRRIRLGQNHLPTGKTRHYLGGTFAPVPCDLRIVKYANDQGFYLFYCNGDGVELTDTYHETLEAAMDQADWEFGIKEEEWEIVSDSKKS